MAVKDAGSVNNVMLVHPRNELDPIDVQYESSSHEPMDRRFFDDIRVGTSAYTRTVVQDIEDEMRDQTGQKLTDLSDVELCLRIESARTSVI